MFSLIKKITLLFFAVNLFLISKSIAGELSPIVSAFNAQMHSAYGMDCPSGMFKFGNANSALCSSITSIPICPDGGYAAQNGYCSGDIMATCRAGTLTSLPIGMMVCVSQFSLLPYGTPSPALFNRCMSEGFGKNRPIPPELVCEQLVYEKYGYGNVTQKLVNQCMNNGEGTGHYYSPEEVCKKMAMDIWTNHSPENPLWIPVQ